MVASTISQALMVGVTIEIGTYVVIMIEEAADIWLISVEIYCM